AIRQSAARLTTALGTVSESDDRSRQLFRWYTGFEGELQVHHTVEDDYFFPALFERVPALRRYLDRIDDEHHELDELIVATRTAIAGLQSPSEPFDDAVARAVAAAGDLEALLDRHLDFEDAEILPLFTRHMDAAEYAEVEARAMAKPKFGQLKFTVPWMIANATADEQRYLFDGAPFMMKVLWVATRRSHDRLTTASLGESASAPTAEVTP
ncbi:MAG TPA: hemerythrin domain-containing protein, partial [Microthrixaceae bacterium]|nr:hemerythrin domain-containing protein [Microthrixaceae bacterium]